MGECLVCWDSFKDSGLQVRHTLVCGHHMCLSCTHRTVKNGILSCPFCRVRHSVVSYQLQKCADQRPVDPPLGPKNVVRENGPEDEFTQFAFRIAHRITQGVRLGKKLEIRVPSADALKTLERHMEFCNQKMVELENRAKVLEQQHVLPQVKSQIQGNRFQCCGQGNTPTLDNHNQECMPEHLKLMAAFVANTDNKNARLRSQIEDALSKRAEVQNQLQAALRERTELSIKQEQLLTTLDSQHSQLVTEGELDAASVEHAPKHVTPLKELAFRAIEKSWNSGLRQEAETRGHGPTAEARTEDSTPADVATLAEVEASETEPPALPLNSEPKSSTCGPDVPTRVNCDATVSPTDIECYIFGKHRALPQEGVSTADIKTFLCSPLTDAEREKLADEQRNLCFDLVERRSLRIWTKSANPETAQILMAIHAVFRKASGQPEWSPERKDDHLWTDCKFTQERSLAHVTHIGSGDACAREAMVVHACAEGNVPLFRGWFDLYFEKDLVEQIYFTVPKQLDNAMPKREDLSETAEASRPLGDLDVFKVATRLGTVANVNEVGLYLGRQQYEIGTGSASPVDTALRMLADWRNSVGDATAAWRELRRALLASGLARIVAEVLDVPSEISKGSAQNARNNSMPDLGNT